MKFRHLVFIFIALALVIAWLTKPGLEDFQEFYAKESPSVAPPVIESQNSFIYSRFNVTHFVKIPATEQRPLAVPQSKSSYIGLFGRFWKMD